MACVDREVHLLGERLTRRFEMDLLLTASPLLLVRATRPLRDRYGQTRPPRRPLDRDGAERHVEAGV